MKLDLGFSWISSISAISWIFLSSMVDSEENVSSTTTIDKHSIHRRSLSDLLDASSVENVDYHHRFRPFRPLIRETIRRHPGRNRKRFSSGTHKFDLARMEIEMMPSWLSHEELENDDYKDITTPIWKSQHSPASRQDKIGDSEEWVEVKDVDETKEKKGWNLTGDQATKAPVVLNFDELRGHTKPTPGVHTIQTTTFATSSSSNPQKTTRTMGISKDRTNDLDLVKRLEKKKSGNRRRPLLHSTSHTPTNPISRSLLELDENERAFINRRLPFHESNGVDNDESEVDLNSSSTRPILEYVNKLAKQIEDEELKAVAEQGPNYVIRDGILYRRDNSFVMRIRPPTPTIRASAADNYRKRKGESDASREIFNEKEQMKVASSNFLLESSQYGGAIVRPPAIRKKMNEAVAIPMVFQSIPQSTYVRPTIEEKMERSSKYIKHDKKVHKFQRHQNGLAIKEINGFALPPTTDSSIVHRANFFIDDISMNNIEDITTKSSHEHESTSGEKNDRSVEKKVAELPPPFPFSHCYMNADGFMCCNRFLESLIRKSYQKLKRQNRFTECSIQKIANRIQRDCEHVFNTTFEVIVGLDDFAIKAHFANDFMCKLEEDHRVITAYSAQFPTMNGVPYDPLAVITHMADNARKNNDQKKINGFVSTEKPNDEYKLNELDKKDTVPFHELSRDDIDTDSTIVRVLL